MLSLVFTRCMEFKEAAVLRRGCAGLILSEVCMNESQAVVDWFPHEPYFDRPCIDLIYTYSDDVRHSNPTSGY